MWQFAVTSVALMSLTLSTPVTAGQQRESRPNARAGASLVRVEASGGDGIIRAVVELDAAALKQAGWLSGWELRLAVESESGGEVRVVDFVLEPGQRFATLASESGLAPGRYSVRAEARAKRGRLVLVASTSAIIPAPSAIAGKAALAMRRGPGTVMAYEPTADPRFRRTERLRIEVPILKHGVASSARVLTRKGQPIPLTVTMSERAEESQEWAMAEVVLAPLAAGDYVFEMSFTGSGEAEIVGYAFRVIP